MFEAEASFERVVQLPRISQPADHAAIVYSDAERAADYCAGFIREGFARREEVIALLPPPLRAAVERRLSPGEREQLRLEDGAETYADFDPEGLTAWYVNLVAQAGRPVRLLAGPDGDAAASIPLDEWRRYERTVHERVHELGVTCLCVYDGPALPAEFMQVALQSHPLMVDQGGRLHRNGEFRYDGDGQAA